MFFLFTGFTRKAFCNMIVSIAILIMFNVRIYARSIMQMLVMIGECEWQTHNSIRGAIYQQSKAQG